MIRLLGSEITDEKKRKKNQKPLSWGCYGYEETCTHSFQPKALEKVRNAREQFDVPEGTTRGIGKGEKVVQPVFLSYGASERMSARKG